MTPEKAKLIKKICEEYAYNPPSNTRSVAADNFISQNKVTRYLHIGIVENIVDDETAHAIAEKAIYKVGCNYGNTRKIREIYRELFRKRDEFISNSETLSPEEIAQKEMYKDHLLATFDATYSDADEFPLSPENIEDKIDDFVGLPQNI